MIYLLPWEEIKTNYSFYFERKQIGTNISFFAINSEYNIGVDAKLKYYFGPYKKFYSLKEAINFVDNYITSSLSNHFYLIPENKVNKFKEKLISLL